jgi:hypothetical protein
LVVSADTSASAVMHPMMRPTHDSRGAHIASWCLSAATPLDQIVVVEVKRGDDPKGARDARLREVEHHFCFARKAEAGGLVEALFAFWHRLWDPALVQAGTNFARCDPARDRWGDQDPFVYQTSPQQ